MTLFDESTTRWTRAEARPLGDRFPVLEQVAGQSVEFIGALADEELPTRVRTIFRKAGIATCGELAGVTEEELGDLRNVGQMAVGDLLRLLKAVEENLLLHARRPAQVAQEADSALAAKAVESALQLLRDEGNPLRHIEPSLEVLAEWSAFNGLEASLGGVVDAVGAPDALPDDVRAAWETVRAFELPIERRSHHDVVDRWLDSLSDRDREIVMHRIVWADRTLDEIGQVHGVSRERIRQIERQLRQGYECLVAEDDWRPVRWAVHRLAARAGAWARVADIPNLDPWQHADRLLMVLAGLEIDDDDEVVHREGFALPPMDDLVYLEPEGEVLDLDDATRRLTSSGVPEERVPHALRHMGLKQLDGIWVRWSRSYVDQSVAILAVVGEPMTADELTERTGSASVRSLRQRLHDDPRVQRVNRAEVGLRSWGLPEYTSVAELMLKVIADSGGSLSVAELATQLEKVYEVKPGTVYAYTAAPVFVVDSGTIRTRGRSEPFEVATDATGVVGLTVLDDERISYDVRVDREVLRGSGRPAPEALAGLLSLQPGRSLRFTARDKDRTTTGSFVVGWSRTSHLGPYLGSLRAQALHDGAKDGDLLRLTFDPAQLIVHHARVTPGP